MQNIDVMIKILEAMKKYSNLPNKNQQKKKLYLYLIDEFKMSLTEKDNLLKKIKNNTSDEARIGFGITATDEIEEICYIIKDFYLFCLKSKF